VPKSGKNDLRNDISRLEAALQENPKSPEFYKLADAYTRVGRFVDAIQLCQEGIKHNPHLAEGYVAQGRALFGTGKLNKAIKVLRKAVMLSESGAEPFRLLGEILLRKDAPTEAVTLLEEALERGINERSIRNLLERARQAVASETTNVIEVPGAEPRGIGNVAVAGTIGTTSEVELTPEMKRRLAQTATSEDKTPLMERAKRGRLLPTSSPDWSSIDDEWEQELDARNTGGFADLESDVGGPFDRPKLGIELPPLTDPLTEGMPPLPADPEDSGQTRLPDDASPAPEDGEPDSMEVPGRGGSPGRTPAIAGSEPVPADVPPPRSGPPPIPQRASHAEEEKTRPVVGRRSHPEERTPAPNGEPPDIALESQPPPRPEPVPLDLAETLPPVAEAEHPTLEREAPAEPDEPHVLTTEPSSEWEVEAPGVSARLASSGEVQFEDLIGLAGTPTPSAELPVREEPVSEPPSALAPAAKRRSRRGVWMLVVFLICSGVGGAGVYLWRHYRAVRATKKALEQTRRARIEGTFDATRRGLQAIDGALAVGGSRAELTGEAELMRALTWLHHGEGPRPRVTASHHPWSHVLAAALLALADGDSARARDLLKTRPTESDDRALQELYLAWADWIEGRRDDAGGHVREALQLQPRLAAAQLLAGHLAREVGDQDEAERACSSVVQRIPGHQLAAACLAAAVMDAGVEDEKELERLLATAPEGPVGKAWQRLLVGEWKLRQGNQVAGIQEIQAALSTAPPRPALMLRGVEVLILSGRLDAARNAWDRLAKLRSQLDPALRLLEARLLLSQGLERSALAKLKDGELPPRGALLRARALVAAGRHKEAAALLSAGTSDEAKVLRSAAKVLDDPKASLALLRELGRRSPRARLYLAQALFQRKQSKDALETVRPLLTTPPLQLEAMTLLARMQMAEGKLAAALGTLDGAMQGSSSRFLPAAELRGLVYLQLGRFREGGDSLKLTLDGGRRSVRIAAALTKCRAMTGNAIEARAALEEARKLGAGERELQTLKGFLLLAEGKNIDAARALKQAEPDLINLVALGRASLADRPAAAERALARAADLDPSHPLPHLWLGKLLLEDGDKRAVEELTTAIRRAERRHFPRSVVVEARLGIVRYRLESGRVDVDLVKQLEQVTKGDPSNATAQRLLGEVYVALKRPRKAEAALRQCVQLDPENASAFYLLGMVIKARPRQVRKDLKRFLELEPKGERAAAVRRRLARLPRR
jgi:tetratricopeptide (TPR) repeat protein